MLMLPDGAQALMEVVVSNATGDEMVHWSAQNEGKDAEKQS